MPSASISEPKEEQALIIWALPVKECHVVNMKESRRRSGPAALSGAGPDRPVRRTVAMSLLVVVAA